MDDSTIKAILIVAAVIGVLAIISIITKKISSAKIDNEIRSAFGKISDREYSMEKFFSIGYFFRKISSKKSFFIDDITWNDLNMDDIYLLINNTTSSMGEEVLYDMLRTPVTSQEELDKREKLINLFETNSNFRIKVCKILHHAGLLKKISAFEYLDKINDCPIEMVWPHVMACGFMIASVASFFLNPTIGIISTIIVFFVNIFSYFKRKSEIEMYYTIVSFMMRTIDTAQGLCDVENSVLQTQLEGLLETADRLKSITKGGVLVVTKSNGGDILEMLMDYIRMATHIDLIKFDLMLKKVKNHQDDFIDLFSKVGYVDACCSIASYRTVTENWTVPEFDTTVNTIKCKKIFHPLLSHPVKNSFATSNCVLITGSNASGKSTFIKTVALNSILAQTINTVHAEKYKASFFRCYSSMALKDSISDGESYYIVEIKSLKRICDAVNPDVPLLVFVDEVLRGTNTLERISASSQILEYLSKQNCIAFAATHDIELTYILENSYDQYHFEEQVTDDDVKFDYKLHEGRAVSRNAIKLLGVLKFEKDIISKAEATLDYYINNGEWQVIQ